MKITRPIRFTKMEGAGNDYIYIDARDVDIDWPELSKAMSDRHFGIGGDGIILLKKSDKADIRMRMFNADGSEGEMCGNGIRCLTKFAVERGVVKASEKGVTVETLAGVRTVVPVMETGTVTRARASPSSTPPMCR
jgi:diaminopimelate epimerase